MIAKLRRWLPLRYTRMERGADGTWAGIGPVWAGEDDRRAVVEVAVHAGKWVHCFDVQLLANRAMRDGGK